VERNNIIRNVIIRNGPYSNLDFKSMILEEEIEFDPPFYGLNQAELFFSTINDYFRGENSEKNMFEILEKAYASFQESKLISTDILDEYPKSLENMIDTFDINKPKSKKIEGWLRELCHKNDNLLFGLLLKNILANNLENLTRENLEKKIKEFGLTWGKKDILEKILSIVFSTEQSFDTLKKAKNLFDPKDCEEEFWFDDNTWYGIINAFQAGRQESEGIESWLLSLLNNDEVKKIKLLAKSTNPHNTTQEEFFKKLKKFELEDNEHLVRCFVEDFLKIHKNFDGLKKIYDLFSKKEYNIAPYREDLIIECFDPNQGQSSDQIEKWLNPS
jgi:hypothetical protein